MLRLSEEPIPGVLGGEEGHGHGKKKMSNVNFFSGELNVLQIISQSSPQREALDVLRLHAQLALRLAAAACSIGSLRLSYESLETVGTSVATRRMGGSFSWPPLRTVR